MTPKGEPGHHDAKQPHIRRLVGETCAARDLGGHMLRFAKIVGHAGDELNEAVDQLARAAVPYMANLPI